MGPEPVDGIAAMLATYGPWGVCVLEGFAIIALAKSYRDARDAKDLVLQTQAKEAIELVKLVTENSVETKNALTRMMRMFGARGDEPRMRKTSGPHREDPEE